MDRHLSSGTDGRHGLRPNGLLSAVMVVVLVISACSAKSKSNVDSERPAKDKPTLVGEYELIGDVDGTQVSDEATVTLTLKKDGTLTLVAVQPGETLDDKGTWSATETTVEITTVDETLMGSGPFELRGDTLILPVLVFDEGHGKSEWKRVSEPILEDEDADSDSADGPAGGIESMWELDGPGAVASAVGMKAYSDAMAEGTNQVDAVQVALEAVLAMETVKSAVVSDNGLNIEIVYDNGLTDVMLTERLLATGEESPSVSTGEDDRSNMTGGGMSTSGLGSAAGLLSSTNLGTASTAAAVDPDPTTCAVLPAGEASPGEPTREGVHPSGGYGVTAYLPKIAVKPINSADSPPVEQRTAVLFSPQYDVTHGAAGDRGTIRDTSGSNIECIEASVSSRGYRVKKILGKDSDPSSTGIKAMAEFSDALAKKPGIVYFLGHGASGKTKNYLDMGPIDMTMEEVEKIVGPASAKLDPSNKIDVEKVAKLNEALTRYLGLPWDPKKMFLNVSTDSTGTPTLWMHPDFFSAIKARGASFSNSLVWLNACSSGATGTFQTAIDAKAFVGWKNDMSGAYIADASEAAFDALSDSARTARGAVQVWQLHSLWEIGSGTADANLNPRSIWAGGGQTEYEPLTGSSHLLLFFIRHAPGTVASDLASNAASVQECYDTYWAGFSRAGIGTTCLHLQSPWMPTEADVFDARFEAGAAAPGAPGAAAGRWTMAD